MGKYQTLADGFCWPLSFFWRGSARSAAMPVPRAIWNRWGCRGCCCPWSFCWKSVARWRGSSAGRPAGLPLDPGGIQHRLGGYSPQQFCRTDAIDPVHEEPGHGRWTADAGGARCRGVESGQEVGPGRPSARMNPAGFTCSRSLALLCERKCILNIKLQ